MLKIVNARMKAITPIYSRGDSLDKDYQIIGNKRYSVLRTTQDGRVIIPLKGKIRVAVENILKSMGESVCDVSKNIKGCGKCRACEIFGHTDKRGRWLVGSLFSEEPVAEIAEIHAHATMKRDSYIIDTKKVYNYQEVKPGAIFNTEIVILDPKDDDLTLLRGALKSLRYIGVGGLVSKGYGRMELLDMDVKDIDYSSFLKE